MREQLRQLIASLPSVAEIFAAIATSPLLRAALVLVGGLILLRIARAVVAAILSRRASTQAQVLGERAVWYSGLVLLGTIILNLLGVSLTALVGALGVAGIAVGFAAQTSLSNIISGVFLIFEHPFTVGDLVKIGDTTGLVLSVDLLSTKLRKFDNTYVRIPNANLIERESQTITRFPIRRVDFDVRVGLGERVERIQQVLEQVATGNPLCLDEPAPIVVFRQFAESSVEFLFGVWVRKEDFLAVRQQVSHQIRERFRDENIDIPVPHRAYVVAADDFGAGDTAQLPFDQP